MEGTDHYQQLIGGCIDAGTEGNDILVEIVDRQGISGFHDRFRERGETCYFIQ